MQVNKYIIQIIQENICAYIHKNSNFRANTLFRSKNTVI